MTDAVDDEYHRRLWERGDLTLRFPADPVGHLQIQSVGDEDSLVVSARGILTLPAGHTASLEMSDEEPAGDLWFLDDLPEDALAGFAAMGVTAEGLRRLVRQRELFQVVLERPGGGDEDLAVLGRLPELEILAVEDDGGTGAWLAALAETALMVLELHRPEVNATALEAIGRIGTLFTLNLAAERIDVDALPALAGLAELESLTLWTDTPPSPDRLAFCAGMPELEILDLKRRDGTDPLTGAERLELLRTLPDLDVNGLWYPRAQLETMTAADLEDLDSAAVRVVDDEAAFDRVLAERGPVLAYFTAGWCGPCKQLGPVIDRFAADYADRLTVAKVDVDLVPEVADRFDVRGVPTLIMLRNGEPVATQAGALPRRDLGSFVDPLL
ncbi:thioredoxin family protein [Actinomadura kijaniata]|uniref:thioredoxin family protein n=1 Tax=Actinomadura kijaniata TaxID=46161 RepID=UPI003F1BAE4D